MTDEFYELRCACGHTRVRTEGRHPDGPVTTTHRCPKCEGYVATRPTLNPWDAGYGKEPT